jgi:hypothetical protein
MSINPNFDTQKLYACKSKTIITNRKQAIAMSEAKELNETKK